MRSMEYIVDKECDLVKFLSEKRNAKNKVKTYVKLGFIYVNNKRVLKLPLMVKVDDVIEIRKTYVDEFDLDILFEDDNYLIVNKQAGLLTISTGKGDGEDTLYRLVREYLNNKGEYAFIVNRIDKETSGIVVFVKSEKLKNMLQDKWNDIVKTRGYIAIVSGKINREGRIDNYLYEDKMTFSHSTKVGGKRAITNYKPVMGNNKYTMLDVRIETGRKNQIRVHMTELGHPIIGDKKYYSKDNPLKRLGLHHYQISFLDPISGRLKTFTKEAPDEFYNLFL